MGQRGISGSTDLRMAAVRAITEEGVGIAQAASLFGVSRQSIWRWVSRYREGGEPGLKEISRRPASSPVQACREKEDAVLKLRQDRAWGAARIGSRVGLAGSTVHRILREHGISKIQVPRKKYPRYEMAFPGELVHIDSKELVPLRAGMRPEFLFAALDGYSREVFLQVFPRADSASSSEFLEWLIDTIPYRLCGVMTDNAWAFTMRLSAHPDRRTPFQNLLERNGVEHRLTKPYHPRTNGKVERFFGTVGRELLRVVRFHDSAHRRDELACFGSYYNLVRPHSAINHHSPTPYRIQYFQANPDVTYVSE